MNRSTFPSHARRPCPGGGVLLAIFLLGFSRLTLEATPRLSEFMADNQSTLADEDGDFGDYLEIYNPDLLPVDLSGYTLTDDVANPAKWTFPAQTLPPGSHLLVWASGKDRTIAGEPLHTNFQLSREPGYLALSAPGQPAALTEFAPYPPQFTDRSYGSSQPEIIRASLSAGDPCRWLVPTGPLRGWTDAVFPDQTWVNARSGLGFDTFTSGTTYHSLFGTGGDLQAALFEKNATAFIRLPFLLTDRRALSGVTFRIKCDDGYLAYLNGTLIARRYAPESPVWNSAATALTDDVDALLWETLEIPKGTAALREGENLLAIHALNGAPDNPDLLLVPELTVRAYDISKPLRTGYFLKPTPGAANGLAQDGFTADTKFSVDRGIFSAPFSLTISCETPGSVIHYTTDSSVPVPGSARVYRGPLQISRTTIVRALAETPSYHPSNVDTQSYLFPADIIRQSAPAGYPTTWGIETNSTGGTSIVSADYAMDQGIVNAPEYAPQIENSLKDSLPVISIASEKGLFFNPDGIYANGRDGSDEIPLSVELLGPGWPRDTQIDAGVRIHGGNARSHPKKPLRLYFRKAYGAPEFRYPLFPDSPVQSFDQLILRPGGHDGWAVPFGNQTTLLAWHATYVRDQFLRLTENAMGRLSPRGRYVHLYLNGLYWGVYDLHERANADYYSSHLGGKPADWDVIHHPTFVGENYSQVDGDGEAWDQVLRLADAGVQNSTGYDALAALVDVDDYIDNLIVRIWAGDYDWCSPMYMKNGTTEAEAGYFDNKNWYAARRSRGGPGKFLFHVWDAEMSMGTHLMLNRGLGNIPSWLSYYPPQRIATFDSTRVGSAGSVAWPYAALRNYPPFRLKFADHLQKHFFAGGRMTTAANIARLESLTSQLELPLIAESARWGDVNRFDPFDLAFTRNDHWKPEITWLRDTFMANRNALVLDQFKAIGLYPGTDAPVTTPPSGTVPAGTPLTFTTTDTANTAIYYTVDGTEPTSFTPFVRNVLIEEGAPCLYWVPTSSIGTSWRDFNGPSNPSFWKSGFNGLGYDREPTYLTHFRTNLLSSMASQRASVYFRMEFNLASQAEINALTSLLLESKYDDGFIAAINGTVVQRVNAPANETSTSVATTLHDDASAVIFIPFNLNLSIVRPLLKTGRNVLAIQGLNQSATSSDFLCTMRLIAQTGGTLSPAPGASLYNGSQPPLLPGNVTVKARALRSSNWSALTESTYVTGVRATSRNIRLSKIHYHPAEPTPDETAAGFLNESAFEYLELYNLSPDTVDLSGCFFTNGISFNFDHHATLRQIPPGGRLLLARDPAALAWRHGPGLPIAGAFTDNTGLSNSGERLRLQGWDGSTILDVTWQDNSPWPRAADGSGPALVFINPGGRGNPTSPLQWRASLAPGGSPGQSDTPTFAATFSSTPANQPLDDPDQDGSPNLLEYATGTDPHNPADHPLLQITPGPGGGYTLTYPLNPEASATLLLEAAVTPAGPWLTDFSPTGTTSAEGSPRQQSWRPALPQPTSPRFFRLRATLP